MTVNGAQASPEASAHSCVSGYTGRDGRWHATGCIIRPVLVAQSAPLADDLADAGGMAEQLPIAV